MVGINWKGIKQGREQRYVSNLIYEDFLKVDLTCLQDHIADYGHTQDSLHVFAKTRLFEERYSGGVLDMNIFCFMLINETDGSVWNTFYTGSRSKLGVEQIGEEDVKQFGADADNPNHESTGHEQDL